MNDACEAIPDSCPCPVGTYCNVAEDVCVLGCQANEHCGPGTVCDAATAACVPGCQPDARGRRELHRPRERRQARVRHRLALAVDGTHLYWISDLATDDIKRVPKGGGAEEVLIALNTYPFSLQLDDQFFYWGDASGKIWKLAK